MQDPQQPTHAPAVALSLDLNALRPLIRVVVVETVEVLDRDRAQIPDRLAYSEEEAARLLSVATHQLRDARLRGEIVASRLMGRRVRYTREDLLGYLRDRRTAQNGEPS